MIYKTHLATSIAVGAGIAKLVSFPFTIGYFSGIALGSLLPDIDEPKSFLGKRLWFLSLFINKKFGHRGLTHSIFAWSIITILLLLKPNNFFIGISLGYFLHLLGDYFSKSGVPIFLPINNKRKKFPLFTYKTSSSEEKLIYIFSIPIALLFIIDKEMLTPLINSTANLISTLINVIINFLEKSIK
jgi:inner membrane protein